MNIPTRDDWNKLSHLKVNSISIFTDGSKLDDKVGGGVFSPKLLIETSFRLHDHCSVYQAEVMPIVEAMKLLQTKRPREQNIFLQYFLIVKRFLRHWTQVLLIPKLLRNVANL